MLTLKIVGGAQLAAKLNDLPNGPKKVLQPASRRALEPMRARAAQLAPRAPGAPDIADNIVISSRARRIQTQVEYAMGPSKGFFYGFFQEFATRFHAAHPFMRPAFNQTWPQVIGILVSELWQAIRTLAGQGVNTSGIGGRFG